jgi:hypothetical protein
MTTKKYRNWKAGESTTRNEMAPPAMEALEEIVADMLCKAAEKKGNVVITVSVSVKAEIQTLVKPADNKPTAAEAAEKE